MKPLSYNLSSVNIDCLRSFFLGCRSGRNTTICVTDDV